MDSDCGSKQQLLLHSHWMVFMSYWPKLWPLNLHCERGGTASVSILWVFNENWRIHILDQQWSNALFFVAGSLKKLLKNKLKWLNDELVKVKINMLLPPQIQITKISPILHLRHPYLSLSLLFVSEQNYSFIEWSITSNIYIYIYSIRQWVFFFFAVLLFLLDAYTDTVFYLIIALIWYLCVWFKVIHGAGYSGTGSSLPLSA